MTFEEISRGFSLRILASIRQRFQISISILIIGGLVLVLGGVNAAQAQEENDGLLVLISVQRGTFRA